MAKKLKRFDSKKANGTDAAGDQTTNETEDGKCKETSGKSRESENGKCNLSEDEIDDLDYDLMEEEEMGIDEEETENESINSSLRSHEYMNEFVSHSTDDSSIVKVTRPCCCNCHQNGGASNGSVKSGKLSNGDSNSSKARPTDKSYCDMSTQTLSTGDIVITMIYVKDAEENNESST